MRTRDRFFGCLTVFLFLLLIFCSAAGSSMAQKVPLPVSGPHDSSAVQMPPEIGTSPERPVVRGGSNAAVLLIAPGDELEVTVYGAPDLSTHARVENDGNILLPLVGLVSVAGETSGHAGKKIEDSLQQAHLVKNPRV